jgi:hypothetical protein
LAAGGGSSSGIVGEQYQRGAQTSTAQAVEGLKWKKEAMTTAAREGKCLNVIEIAGAVSKEVWSN